MVTQDQPIYRYCVDEQDVITNVDHWWLAFAQENNALGLTDNSVVGQLLWDFISDEPTRMLYNEIHSHVRSTGNPITIPFRCDSPTLQRFMELTISKHRDRQLLYESTLMRAVPQRRLSVLDPEQKRSGTFLTMCSFCKRCLIEPADWLALENIALKLRLYDEQTVPGLIFTVCPSCEGIARRRRRQSHPVFN
jgi:hypothetical protein